MQVFSKTTVYNGMKNKLLLGNNNLERFLWKVYRRLIQKYSREVFTGNLFFVVHLSVLLVFREIHHKLFEYFV